MICREWIERLNRLAPESIAMEWDNPGLLVGGEDREIRKTVVALDATDQVIDLAVSQGADLLLTHHPLIFSSLKRINESDFIGRRLIRLIRSGIACYAMHTNYDAAPGCMADLAAGKLHLVEGAPLEVVGEKDGVPFGIGKTGILLEAESLKDLALRVKKEFDLPFVTVYGSGQVSGLVRRAAVCPGSCRGMIDAAVRAGAQVLISGDVGHHDGIDAAARGLAVIDAGHYGLEHIFVDHMAAYCAEKIDPRAVIVKAPPAFPAISL